MSNVFLWSENIFSQPSEKVPLWTRHRQKWSRSLSQSTLKHSSDTLYIHISCKRPVQRTKKKNSSDSDWQCWGSGVDPEVRGLDAGLNSGPNFVWVSFLLPQRAAQQRCVQSAAAVSLWRSATVTAYGSLSTRHRTCAELVGHGSLTQRENARRDHRPMEEAFSWRSS